jgi:hypothetical protein
MITGGPTTVIEVLVVFPAPPSLAVIWVELFFTPTEVPVTLTTTVQLEFAAAVPPDKVTVLDPAIAVSVPPQELVSPFGVATESPEGRVSVKASPVSGIEVLELPMVKVRVVVPLSGMDEAPNEPMIVGGVATLRFADDELPVPALFEVTALVVFV